MVVLRDTQSGVFDTAFTLGPSRRNRNVDWVIDTANRNDMGRFSHSSQILMTIAAIGLVVRCVHTDVFVYSDECFTWRVCETPFVEMLQRVGADTLPPLHFVLLKAWVALWGDAPLAIRGLSIVCGVLCVPAAYFTVGEACRRLPGAASGALLAAALVAVNAVQITHSRIARPYPLTALLGLCGTWLLLVALRPARDELDGEQDVAPTRTTRWWWAYGAAASLFCLAHHFALLTLTAHAIVALGVAVRLAMTRRYEAAKSVLRGIAVAAIGGAVVYSPWLPVFVAQAQRTKTWFWVPARGFDETLAALYEWNVGLPPESVLVAGLCLVCVFAAGVFVIRRAPVAGWLFSLMFALPWLLTIAVSTLGGRPLLQERYLLFANAGLLALLGATFAVLDSRIARVAIAGVLGTVFLPATTAYLRSLPSDTPAMAKAMDWLKNQHRPGDVVTVDLPQTVNISKYYAHLAGLEIDARVYLMSGVEGGQPIHTTSLHGSELLADGPHAPPPDAERWWRLDVQEQWEMPKEGWRELSQTELLGPTGTREVAGSERVSLKLHTKTREPESR